MADDKQSQITKVEGGTEAPLASGENYSLDFTIGNGGVNAMNNALTEVCQPFPRYHFKATSITFLADAANSGTIYVGSASSAKFPLTKGVAVSDRHSMLDTIGIRGTNANDVVHIKFVAE
jgi:hypothetical protein